MLIVFAIYHSILCTSRLCRSTSTSSESVLLPATAAAQWHCCSRPAAQPTTFPPADRRRRSLKLGVWRWLNASRSTHRRPWRAKQKVENTVCDQSVSITMLYTTIHKHGIYHTYLVMNLFYNKGYKSFFMFNRMKCVVLYGS